MALTIVAAGTVPDYNGFVPTVRSIPAPWRRMIQSGVLGLVASTLIAPLASAQDGQDDDEEFFDRTPERCISTNRIRDTEILDDETVLFYLRGRRAYINMLDYTCNGLASAGRFAMEVRSGRLCSVDTITVIYVSSRIPGMTCRLGEFYPIPWEEAELLKLESNEQLRARQSVVVTPVESETEDTEAEELGDSDPNSEIGDSDPN
jgi:hypothetical protein